MSYSRTYTGSVYYSGSVSVSYPASEHGGTTSASYSGSVPVSVNLYVDTRPFDSSVGSCNNSVNLLTGSIVAMDAAQVKSINDGAKEISGSVINGFYNMISSELSQEMGALYSKFNAVSALLQDRSQTLAKQQLIMKSDYDRTSKRYQEIFSDLDEELGKRIAALDKKAIEIAKKIQNEQLHHSVAKKIAQFCTGVSEDEIVNEQLLIANTKSRVNKVVEDLAGNVIQEKVYGKKMNDIIREESCTESTPVYIPVVYLEKDDFADVNTKSVDCYASPVPGIDSETIGNSLKNYLGQQLDGWHNLQEKDQSMVDAAFKAFAEKSLQEGGENAQRIYDTIMMLKKQSESQTL